MEYFKANLEKSDVKDLSNTLNQFSSYSNLQESKISPISSSLFNESDAKHKIEQLALLQNQLESFFKTHSTDQKDKELGPFFINQVLKSLENEDIVNYSLFKMFSLA